MSERIDTDTLHVDDMHVVWPRAAGLDVHKMCITAAVAPLRGGPRIGAHGLASSARCPTGCGR